MLKPISRLRLACKGNLNNTLYSNVHRIRKKICRIIPVLSIFALLGMITYAVAIISFGDVLSSTEEAYAAVNPLSSLIIDNGEFTDNTTTDGSIFYSSHTIQVKASDIDGYALTITGPTNIVNGSTTIGSAGNNVIGSSIPNNKWGYAWGDQATADSNMLYKGFTGNAQTLDDNTTTTISKNAVDFTKKLVFAVKFADNADIGHYKANVTLNLTLIPKEITARWSTGVKSGITTMQEMKPSVCTQVATPIDTNIPTLKLEDSRDGKEYTIARLKDGNCWMIDNLALDISNKILTSSDSDVSSNYFAGVSSEITTASDWLGSSNGGNTTAMFNMDGLGDTEYNSVYGYYYSWCAATAGTCASVQTDNVDAPSSICPAGWRLPKGSVSTNTNDLAQLAIKDGASLPDSLIKNSSYVTLSWSSNINAGPPAYFTLGGANWYFAGFVYDKGAFRVGSEARHWTRTGGANAGTSARGCDLSTNGTLYLIDNVYRYTGYPIRCIAYSS